MSTEDFVKYLEIYIRKLERLEGYIDALDPYTVHDAGCEYDAKSNKSCTCGLAKLRIKMTDEGYYRRKTE